MGLAVKNLKGSEKGSQKGVARRRCLAWWREFSPVDFPFSPSFLSNLVSKSPQKCGEKLPDLWRRVAMHENTKISVATVLLFFVSLVKPKENHPKTRRILLSAKSSKSFWKRMGKPPWTKKKKEFQRRKKKKIPPNKERKASGVARQRVPTTVVQRRSAIPLEK